MPTTIDLNAGEAPFTPPMTPSDPEWSSQDGEPALHQEINDRRARLESAETLRLARAL